MKLKIYQIDLDRDTNAVAFMGFDALPGSQENEMVQAEIYDKVYEGTVDAKDLEDVYRIFNLEKPEDFCGRSLSVSDVVEVTGADNVAPGFYYCDRVGFRAIGFEPEKSREQESGKIRVIKYEPRGDAAER